MAKRGRPRKEFDRKLFESLCGLQCTLDEIASVFSCDNKTVEQWCKREYGKNFSEIFREKRNIGKISLRRAQWRLAEKSPAMAIFLGKNFLGQTDKQDVEVSGPNNAPVVMKHQYDLSGLSMGEIMTLEAILSKVESNKAGGVKDGPTQPE